MPAYADMTPEVRATRYEGSETEKDWRENVSLIFALAGRSSTMAGMAIIGVMPLKTDELLEL